MKVLITWLILFTTTSLKVQAAPNLRFPTLGGMQFWTDIKLRNAWKIQRNCITRHYRLLSPHGVRFAWGSKKNCLLQLNKQTRAINQGPLIILLHGLGRSHYSMTPLRNELRALNYDAHCIEYSSLLCPIDTLSQSLQSVCSDHENRDIYIITHSYGAIVLRHFGKSPKNTKIDRAVLIAAPNQGSKVIDFFKSIKIDFLLGPSARNLGLRSGSLQELPTPSFPFITIAGTQKKLPYLPFGAFLHGKSDGIVEEKNTRLNGSQQHFKVFASHTFIMNSPQTIGILKEYFLTKQAPSCK